jgi:hypothetical protein
VVRQLRHHTGYVYNVLNMKVKEYIVFSEAVETGINRGWNRAFKHLDCSDEVRKFLDQYEETIKHNIYLAVTGDVCEYFSFDTQHTDEQ